MWSVPSVGGNPTKTELQLSQANNFSLNPDGRQVAFQAGAQGPPQIWVMENALPGRLAAAK